MAYKKTYRKKTYGKKKTYVKKAAAFTYTGAAYKALQLALKLKGIINSELKNLNANVYNTTVTSTASVGLMTGIGQGDTEVLRNGNSILLKSIELKGHLDFVATYGTVVDLYIIEDKKAVNATAPTYAQMFVGTPANQNIWKNMDQEGRFVIKWHKQIVQDTKTSIPIDEKILLGDNHHVKWTSATATDTESGHYYFLACSNISVNPPVLYLDERLRWYDN